MFQKIKDVILCIKYPGKGNSSTYHAFPRGSTFDGKRVLNLGCGSSTFSTSNVVNLDYINGKGVDCVWDLSMTPLPFKDQEFDLIIANMVLEHIENWWGCFRELSRILKVGGTIYVSVPGDGGSSQLGYRDHLNVINDYSFTGLGKGLRNNANIWEIEDAKHNGNVRNLILEVRNTRLANYWWIAIMPQSVQLWMANHLRNVVAEQIYSFKKVKHD